MLLLSKIGVPPFTLKKWRSALQKLKALFLPLDGCFVTQNAGRPRQGKVDNRLLPGKAVKVSGKR
jgi:hypothetical protein